MRIASTQGWRSPASPEFWGPPVASLPRKSGEGPQFGPQVSNFPSNRGLQFSYWSPYKSRVADRCKRGGAQPRKNPEICVPHCDVADFIFGSFEVGFQLDCLHCRAGKGTQKFAASRAKNLFYQVVFIFYFLAGCLSYLEVDFLLCVALQQSAKFAPACLAKEKKRKKNGG